MGTGRRRSADERRDRSTGPQCACPVGSRDARHRRRKREVREACTRTGSRYAASEYPGPISAAGSRLSRREGAAELQAFMPQTDDGSFQRQSHQGRFAAASRSRLSRSCCGEFRSASGDCAWFPPFPKTLVDRDPNEKELPSRLCARTVPAHNPTAACGEVKADFRSSPPAAWSGRGPDRRRASRRPRGGQGGPQAPSAGSEHRAPARRPEGGVGGQQQEPRGGAVGAAPPVQLQ